MNRNELLVFVGLALVCFFGVFVRRDLFGFDSYALWSAISSNNFVNFPRQPLANFLFVWFPSNITFFKLFMFSSFCFALGIVWFYAKKWYGEKDGWLITFCLLGFFPVFLFEFAKFENELFAFPLIVLGVFWLLDKKWYFFVPLLVSVGFWLWPGYFFVSTFGWVVLEQQFLVGLFGFFVGVFVLPFFYFRDSWLVRCLGSVFLVFFLFQSKLWVFLVPFMVIGIGELLVFVKQKQQAYNFVVLVPLFLIIAFNLAIIMQQPTANDWFFVDEAIKLAKDNNFPLYNDWSFGYWLEHRGVNTNFKGAGKNPDYNFLDKPFVALTDKNLSTLGCTWTDGLLSSTRSINIWLCD